MKHAPIGLRLDDADRKKLDALMSYHGWDQANMLRWLIREEYKRIAPPAAPKVTTTPVRDATNEAEGFE